MCCFSWMLRKYYGANAPALHWAGLAVTLARSKQVPSHLRKLRGPAHICIIEVVRSICYALQNWYLRCVATAKALQLASYCVLRASQYFAI